MFLSKKAWQLVLVLPIVVTLVPTSFGFDSKAGADSVQRDSQREAADSIEFVKLFHIGMSYAEVQQAMPKGVQMDVPSYNVGDHSFMLEAEIKSSDSWSAYFIFDTADTSVRRPVRLVELSCSTTIDGSAETFESVVSQVSGSFGDPEKLDQSQKLVRQAGWRVSGGSTLTVEYSPMPSESRVLVDFVVKAPKQSKAPDPVASLWAQASWSTLS
jgi:hypothetical protein